MPITHSLITAALAALSIFSPIRARAQAPARIPLTYGAENKPMVDCAFNGAKGSCVFDTGSYLIIVPGAIAPTMTEMTAQTHKPPYDGCKQVSARVTIADYVAHAAPVYACGPNARGNIGVPALGPTIWKFDLVNARLEMQEQMPATLQREPLVRDAVGHMAAHFKLGDAQFVGALDTGSFNTMMDLSVVEKAREHFSEPEESGTIGDVPITSYKVRGLTLNGRQINLDMVDVFDFKKVYGSVLKSGWSAIIGEDVLKGRTWYFDFASNTWALE